VRLFIAINLPDPERHAIHRATAPLRGAARAVTWVAPECLHVTMKFLGDQEPEMVASVRDALTGVARRFQPRIFWVGIASDTKLELLHHELEVACEGLGHEVEARAFRPHITLGRAKRDISREEIDALGRAVPAVKHRATVNAGSIDIMQSELSAAGPRYTLLEALPLGHS
jgi:2'-5' RNA ligase